MAGGHEHVVPGAAVLATEHLVAVLVHDVGDRGQEAAQDPSLGARPCPSMKTGLAQQVDHVSAQTISSHYTNKLENKSAAMLLQSAAATNMQSD